MELKKSSKANLEKRRFLFLQIGFVLSLGIVFMAFNRGSEVNSLNQFDEIEAGPVIDEGYTPPTNTPKPPPPPKPVIIDKLLITDAPTVLDEPYIESSEINEGTIIDALPEMSSDEKDFEEDEIFTTVKDMPEFPGGEDGLLYWIAKSIKYPQNAIDMGIDGTVYVRFVIDTNGSVTNASVLRGIDPLLNKEALRVINNMPQWKPGMQNGKNVKVMYVVPIRFQLNL